MFIDKLDSSVFLAASHRPVVSETNVVGCNQYFLKENRILKIESTTYTEIVSVLHIYVDACTRVQGKMYCGSWSNKKPEDTAMEKND